MSNANRDYAIVYDVKNSSLVLSRPLSFYITDKNTSNIFVKLVTKVSVGNGIDQYTDIENASNYVLTMRVIKPNNEVKSLEATQHEPENIFQFDLTEDFKDIPGKYICELTISTIVSARQELITSDPFNYEVKRSILSNVGEIIETEDTTVEKLLNDLETTKAEFSSQIKDIAINIKALGAKGDGVTDDTSVIQEALNMGGNIFIPDGTYIVTEELTITNSNTKIFGYGVNKSILKYEGRGTEGFFLNIKGLDADNYIENVSITAITIDCTDQWYKGGNSDETPKDTSPSPRYIGMVGINIKYGKHIIVEDVFLNDVYGDGIVISRSSHCIINRNKLYNCGAGNIISNDYTGWDNHGDGIVAFFSYHIDITNNVVINKRVYLTHESYPGSVNDVYGLPCGRSGLEFEYKMSADAPLSNPDNHPTYNAPGYDEFTTRDGFGLRMSNNYVYGYTKGIHLESNVRCLIDANKMIKNHIAILHSGGELTHIINNYISNEGLPPGPQVGYNLYDGGVAITNYDGPNLVLVDGNTIDITTPDKTKRTQAICLGRACIRISNNSIKTDSWGIYETAQMESAPSKGVFIVDNEFIAKANSDVKFIYKYYNHAEWVISGNSFTNMNTTNILARLILGTGNMINSGGVFINNNIFNNVKIEVENQGCNANISNNTFYALSNFPTDESLISFVSMNNIAIESNRFYVHEGSRAKYCIRLRDSGTNISIRKNMFYISSLYMTTCCYLPNSITNLILEKNNINTTSTNLIFSTFNWTVKSPIIKENNISNPHCNYIATGGSMHGLIDIFNNLGLIEYNIHTNFKYEGLFIPLGFILKDYSQNANKSVYGEACVVEGTYTKNTWKASTSYTTGDYFAHNDIVYKVNNDFTSESIFDAENLTEIGKLCKLKTISLV